MFSSDPRGFEGDGCDPAVTGCSVVNVAPGAGTSTPYSMPVFANFTIIGPGPLAGFPTDGNGAVLRRGTGGSFMNGMIARWPGVWLQIRDAFTDSLRLRDSLNVANVILAENGPTATPTNYDAAGMDTDPALSEGSRRFGQASKFAAWGHRTGTSAAALVSSLAPAALDWTPIGAATTGGSVVVPPKLAARTGGYFGGTFVNTTTYVGAADPVGPKWWQGWTLYATN